MVQILPRYDLGGDIGKAFGQGVGESISQSVDRKRLLQGLESLNDLDLNNMSRSDILKTTTKAFAGIPGGMQLLQEILPTLLTTNQSTNYAENAYGNNKPQIQPQNQEFSLRKIQRNPQENVEGQVQPEIQPQGQVQPKQQNVRPELAPTAQKVPGLQEDIPAYTPMTKEEKYQRASALAKAGMTPQQIENSIDLEEKRKLQQWQSLVSGKEARTKQFAEERALEDVQQEKIRNYAADELGIAVDELNPYETRKAYEYFKEQQQKNPKLQDRQVWNKARQEFNAMRESFSKGENLLKRPAFISLSANKRLKEARQWAQSHLKNFGDTREDRDKLMTLFTGNDYTKAEAASIVKPLSEGLEKTVKQIGRAQTANKENYIDVAKKEIPLQGENRKQYVDKLSTAIAKNLQPADSILLLRERLFRDDAVDEEMFSEALNRAQELMKEQGKALSQEQDAEIPDLQNKVKPSLMDLLIGEEGFDIRKYFPRFQK